jgi:hypothetical protein
MGWARSVRTPLQLLILILLISTAPVRAGELFLLGGIMQNSSVDKNSYSWQLEYIEGLGENLALGVTYLNEGHVPNHHRDGNALQLWTRTRLLDRRLSLAAGAGPYFYHDTMSDSTGQAYQNNQGLGAILSTSITWQSDSRWLFHLQSNWVECVDSFDTFSALAGIGYHFGEPVAPGAAGRSSSPDRGKPKNEITLFTGLTILNSFKSENAVALAVEYRRRILPWVDWTGTWLHEGDSRPIRRSGLASELWAVRDFMDQRLSLGIGAGAYIPIDQPGILKQSGFPRKVCGILSMTASYLVLMPWDVRVSWERVITDNNHDSDVILGGVGYRF